MNPIQSFKQVFVDGPATRVAATNIQSTFVVGVDNYVGPTGNQEVPTGATINSINVQIGFSTSVNLVNLIWTVQLLRSGQGVITPNAQGGNPQRNQVIHTMNFMLNVGTVRNFNTQIRIPPKFQRVREGDLWTIVSRGDTAHTSIIQVIYAPPFRTSWS